MQDVKYPRSMAELYDMMCNTEDLCGKFELVGGSIFWEIYNGIDIEIDCETPYFGITKNYTARFLTELFISILIHPKENDIWERYTI